MHRARPRTPALLLAALALLAVPAAASATTIHVAADSAAADAGCGSVAAPCATLAAGIAAAPAGATVEVAPGTYAAATIDKPLVLTGAQADISGGDRTAGMAGASRIVGTLRITAAVGINGFELAGSPAVAIQGPMEGAPLRGLQITNNVLHGSEASPLLVLTGAATSVVINANRFEESGAGNDFAAGDAIALQGDAPRAPVRAEIRGNVFRSLGGAAVHARGTPGLLIAGNDIEDARSLLVAYATGSATERITVRDNLGRGLTGPVLVLGSDVQGIDVHANRVRGAAGAFVYLNRYGGGAAASDLQLRGNDVEDVEHVVNAVPESFVEPLVLRGNRLVNFTDGAIRNDTATASIDARGNWWGSNDPLDRIGPITGAADVDQPLQLVIATAPSLLFAGGSGAVEAVLRMPAQLQAEPSAQSFMVGFSSTGALDATSAPLRRGAARTVLSAGSVPGELETTVMLDDESLRARTVVRTGEDPDGDGLPGITRPTPPGTVYRPGPGGVTIARTKVRVRANIQRRSLLHAGSHPIRLRVYSSRPAAVHSAVVIDFFTARRLGLRARTSPTREDFVLGRVRTRWIRGLRVIRIELSDRARFAIRRADGRVPIRVVTRLEHADGRSVLWRSAVIPAT